MTEQTFNECFTWVEKYHGKTGHLDPQVRIDWWEDFQKEHDEIFFEAANLACDKMPPGMFPSKERMRGFVTEGREKLWQKVKDSEPRKPITQLGEQLEARDPQKITEGEDALRTVLRFLESKRDPVDAYLELDQRWPGKGWDIAAQSQRELRATIREKMERYEAPAPPEPPEEERKYIQERASKIRSLFGDAE